ncbi:MAG: hypothetical protein L0346_11245, partial [Chloroflexi bacterium]|nr:hypothetical protein [Chloroflexota bacterium]
NQGMVLTFEDSQVLDSTSTYWGGGAIYNDGGRLDVKGSNLAYNQAQGEFGFGGAIFNDNADLLVSQSVLMENSGDGVWGYGGAIYAVSSGVVVDQSWVVHNDSADYGGGIYLSNGWLHVYRSAIEDNYAPTTGGGILVSTAATFKLVESTVTGNVSDLIVGDGGGGLYLGGDTAEITDSQISGNSAAFGGGLFQEGGETIISRSTISDNGAFPDGGGIYHRFGAMTLVQSTVSDNHAIHGAGIFNHNNDYGYTRLVLVNTTVSGNIATIDGGGIFNHKGDVSLYSATVAANQADGDEDKRGAGGGIFNESGGVRLQNTLLADNFHPDSSGDVPDDCFGDVYSDGYNLIESDSVCHILGDLTGNIIGQDPQLGPLQDNGGLTWTQAIPLGSPAVETAHPGGCLDDQGQLLEDDQRGFGRHLDGDGDDEKRCDIGAYENGEGMWPSSVRFVQDSAQRGGKFIRHIQKRTMMAGESDQLTAEFLR